MPNEVRMTRQIRVYEDSAQVIEAVARIRQNRGDKVTFADIVEEALRHKYGKAYDKVQRSLEQMVEALSEDIEGESQSDDQS